MITANPNETIALTTEADGTPKRSLPALHNPLEMISAVDHSKAVAQLGDYSAVTVSLLTPRDVVSSRERPLGHVSGNASRSQQPSPPLLLRVYMVAHTASRFASRSAILAFCHARISSSSQPTARADKRTWCGNSPADIFS
jgi:hypothetical protein